MTFAEFLWLLLVLAFGLPVIYIAVRCGCEYRRR